MQTTLNIKGKKIAVKFGYQAIRTYENETGLSYANILQDISSDHPKLTAVIGLLYSGMVGAGDRPDMDEVANMAMQMTSDELTRLYKAYIESYPKPEPVTDTEERTAGAIEPDSVGE